MRPPDRASLPLRLLIQLSLRNVLRHKRRNGILLSAILVAVAAVVVSSALIRGFQRDMAEAAVANLTGHIKVLAPGYLDDPNVQRSFSLTEDWRPELDDRALAGWAPRMRIPAAIMSERNTRGIQFVGIDPAREGISFIGSAALQGQPLSGPEDRRILLGRALAEQLETGLGRRLVIIVQGVDGRNREAGFRIAGLYDADGTALEKAYVFTGLKALQNMVEAEVVTELSIVLRGESALLGLKAALAEFFTGLEVLDWQALEPGAAAVFAVADTAIFVMFIIMMSALIFGLVNALATSVMERIRELGLLRALGMRPGSVILQVVLESSILMLVGVLAGTAAGILFICYLGDGIDLTRWAQGVEMLGLRGILKPVPRLADMVLIGALSMALGVLASLYPARQAVKIKPLQALGR